MGEDPLAGLQRSRQPGPLMGDARQKFGLEVPVPRNTEQTGEPERLERLGSVRYEGSGAVRAALGRRNPYERLGAGRYGTDSLTLWSGSLWRMQQVLRTKGHRAVSYGFELPDHQESERDCLRGRTADTSPFGRVSCRTLQRHKRGRWRLGPSPRTAPISTLSLHGNWRFTKPRVRSVALSRCPRMSIAAVATRPRQRRNAAASPSATCARSLALYRLAMASSCRLKVAYAVLAGGQIDAKSSTLIRRAGLATP